MSQNSSYLKWIGTLSGMGGAFMIALNIPQSYLGFFAFLMSSICWMSAGLRMREPSIWSLQLVFTFINVLGIYRWG